ncbi:hypothetical protein [Actibacterium sp. XHP0104]|uniref:hypothetical protein n=1 Tax=Actibacterium sp. XHP0104 TaxID=2984335 RepID=UPI0021E8ED38|nr:hypothetical protein [Actibacterium sp. XHP0104]MCV2881235.1 hypothetical protein [Actibacterium sp. XHP0104]
MSKKKRLYVSGLWIIADNPKNDADHYASLLPRTFDLLSGSTVWFYTNNDTVTQEISELAQTRGIDLVTKRLEIPELPGWDASNAALAACENMKLDRFARPKSYANEKGVVHYWRDLKGGGADTYRAMLAIWLSKVALTSAAARTQQQGSIAWVDASVSRFSNKRSNWDFTHDPGEVGKISHYATPMRYLGRALPLNASYMEGTLTAWNRLEGLFNDALIRSLEAPYGHDEETVLGQCISEAPDLFRCIGGPKGTEKRKFPWLRLRKSHERTGWSL